jgi:trk system potassium uptake protein TrkH
LQHPGRVIALAFAAAVLIGTLLLSLPIATADGNRADLVTALFTATSAVCVTGLITVDTATFWSGFGEIVIIVLIQAGGLGIMTLATLVVVLLSRRMGLRVRSVVQAETKALSAADIRRVVRNVVLFSFAVEMAVAAVLTGRLLLAYDYPLMSAVRSGAFHAVSAFNNAGFSIYPDNLVRFVGMSGSASRWRWR